VGYVVRLDRAPFDQQVGECRVHSRDPLRARFDELIDTDQVGLQCEDAEEQRTIDIHR
jgi:hypothetical protein